jgi:multidrug resistance efflux pump
MSYEIKAEIARAKRRASNLMQTALELKGEFIGKAKLALEDYRRANELGQAMLVSLEKAGLR